MKDKSSSEFEQDTNWLNKSSRSRREKRTNSFPNNKDGVNVSVLENKKLTIRKRLNKRKSVEIEQKKSKSKTKFNIRKHISQLKVKLDNETNNNESVKDSEQVI